MLYNVLFDSERIPRQRGRGQSHGLDRSLSSKLGVLLTNDTVFALRVLNLAKVNIPHMFARSKVLGNEEEVKKLCDLNLKSMQKALKEDKKVANELKSVLQKGGMLLEKLFGMKKSRYNRDSYTPVDVKGSQKSQKSVSALKSGK